MIETRTQLGPSLSIKDHLAWTDVCVGHALLVHKVKSTKNSVCNVFEYGLWNCANALSEVEEAAISSIIGNYGNTALWWVPLRGMYPNEQVNRSIGISVRAIVLPVGHPIVKHLSDLHICNWNFFHCVDFQSWRVQHFLYCSWGRFENAERYHLIEAQVFDFGSLFDVALHLSQVLHRILFEIRKGGWQIHDLLLIADKKLRNAF